MAFAALVWATGRRYAAQLAAPGSGPMPPAGATTEDDRRPDSSMRRLFASRFVVLILAYQVLSALGSQLSDFLVFDRATAQYPASADLARFLAGYTAVMNVVSIAFLFLVAGPLLRRFGLRLGIAANPLVLTVFAVGMAAVFAATGGTSLALLLTVSAARIADIALTDGTTRTSINALYQVLPERARLSVQTTVEGIGVPVAIGDLGRAHPRAQCPAVRTRCHDRRHDDRVRGLDVDRDPPLPGVRAGARAGAATAAPPGPDCPARCRHQRTRPPRAACSRARMRARRASASSC